MKKIELVDVGPRDGIQSQSTIVSTSDKIELISRLADSGVKRIEVASFVNPKRVPQMADVELLIESLPKIKETKYIGLVLNEKGLERALDTDLDEINCATVTTDTFCQRNQGKTSQEMMNALGRMTTIAKKKNRFFGVTIAAAFGCPFEGEVDPTKVLEIAKNLIGLGVDEISIADTIGVAVPTQVTDLVYRLKSIIGEVPLRLHFHNTRNTGIGNVYAAAEAGVRIFDSSCGGLGGCPFAPGATGNVGTEDVLYLFERMGYQTSISMAKLIETSKWLGEVMGQEMPAMLNKAGSFP